MARIQGSRNLCAFLDMLAHAEGTFGKGDDGYNVLVGGTLFDSYADHPRRLVILRNREGVETGRSTAAGRYQLLQRYFDPYKKLLNLPDFSPESQDKIAVQQIEESHALSAVEAGEFTVAVALCAHIWASLPGAGYHQREKSLAQLNAAYIEAGGKEQA